MIVTGNILLAALLILLLNIPFGYWRRNVTRFGLQWFLAIHIPVPFVVLIRYTFHTGWHWSSFVLFVSSFFLGQLLGGSLYKKIKRLRDV